MTFGHISCYKLTEIKMSTFLIYAGFNYYFWLDGCIQLYTETLQYSRGYAGWIKCAKLSISQVLDTQRHTDIVTHRPTRP